MGERSQVLFGFLNPFRIKMALQLRAAGKRYRRRPGPREAFELSRLLAESGDRAAAMNLLQGARRSFPKAGELRKLHEALIARAAAAEIQSLERSFRSGASAEEMTRLIELHRSLRNFERCLQVAREAERRFPDSWILKLAVGKTFYHRFVVSRAREDGQKAVEYLRQSRRLKPDCARAVLYLAALLCELGQRAEASAAAEDLLHLAPTNERAKRLWARLRGAAKQADAARRAGAVRQAEAAPQAEARPPCGSELFAGVMEKAQESPSVWGAFVFDPDGGTLKRHVTPNDHFEMEGHDASIAALARAAQTAAEKIGIGRLRTCLIEGGPWRIHLGDLGGGMLAVFTEHSYTSADFEGLVKRSPLQAVSR